MAGPRWVRLDVDYFRNPKVLVAGRDGRDLHLASICWVGSYLTDGHIPLEAVDELARTAGVRRTADAVDRTITAGLWIPNGAGYDLKDYVDMNGTRAEAEREREMYRERQRRYNARRRRPDDA